MAKKAPQNERKDADRRVRQCERLARLMQTLHLIMGRGRWDADGLAEELECSRRTVFRLLQTLSLAGVPWYFDEQRRAYKVRAGYRFPMLEEDPAKEEQDRCLPDELDVLAGNLNHDGEAFAKSLQQFLDALKLATRRI
jgi:predicted DNA-binding transcriptional regulator YafY